MRWVSHSSFSLLLLSLTILQELHCYHKSFKEPREICFFIKVFGKGGKKYSKTIRVKVHLRKKEMMGRKRPCSEGDQCHGRTLYQHCISDSKQP